jgi:hypothetical protein
MRGGIPITRFGVTPDGLLGHGAAGRVVIVYV